MYTQSMQTGIEIDRSVVQLYTVEPIYTQSIQTGIEIDRSVYLYSKGDTPTHILTVILPSIYLSIFKR